MVMLDSVCSAMRTPYSFAPLAVEYLPREIWAYGLTGLQVDHERGFPPVEVTHIDALG